MGQLGYGPAQQVSTACKRLRPCLGSHLSPGTTRMYYWGTSSLLDPHLNVEFEFRCQTIITYITYSSIYKTGVPKIPINIVSGFYDLANRPHMSDISSSSNLPSLHLWFPISRNTTLQSLPPRQQKCTMRILYRWVPYGQWEILHVY